jgi:hypothetical protein
MTVSDLSLLREEVSMLGTLMFHRGLSATFNFTRTTAHRAARSARHLSTGGYGTMFGQQTFRL